MGARARRRRRVTTDAKMSEKQTQMRFRFCFCHKKCKKTNPIEECDFSRLFASFDLLDLARNRTLHRRSVRFFVFRGVYQRRAKFDMSDDDDRGAASEAGAPPRDRGSTGESRRVRVRVRSETWTRAARSRARWAARVDGRGRSSTDSAFHFGALLRSRPRRGEARTPVDVRHDGAGELLVGFHARRP